MEATFCAGGGVALGHEYGPAEPADRGSTVPHTSPSVHTARGRSEDRTAPTGFPPQGEDRAPPGGQEGSED